MVLTLTPYIVFCMAVLNAPLVDKLWRIGGHN